MSKMWRRGSFESSASATGPTPPRIAANPQVQTTFIAGISIPRTIPCDKRSARLWAVDEESGEYQEIVLYAVPQPWLRLQSTKT